MAKTLLTFQLAQVPRGQARALRAAQLHRLLPASGPDKKNLPFLIGYAGLLPICIDIHVRSEHELGLFFHFDGGLEALRCFDREGTQ